MKIIYQDSRCIALAGDDFDTEYNAMPAPQWLKPEHLALFQIRLGKLVFPFRGIWYPAANELMFQKLQQIGQIARYCEAAMRSGCAYLFPDGKSGTVQTRNDFDMVNLGRIATSGLILRSEGSKAVFTQFRDMENVLHPLTPEQAIALHKWVSAYVERQATRKWAYEDLVMAAETPEALAAVDIGSSWGQ